MINKSYTLASNADDVLYILKVIKEDEKDSTSLIDHPVLIGSRAAKWHISFFRDPNDWDLLATISQSIQFINMLKSNSIFKYIKLIYYSGNGLKIVGKCIESSSFNGKNHENNGNLILFNIELISDKVDFRKMKPNKKTNYSYDGDENDGDLEDYDDDDYIEKENSNNKYDSDEYNSIESDDEDINSDINSDKEDNTSSDTEDNSNDEDNDSNDDYNMDTSIFESFEDTKPRTSSLMILELCHDIKDKIMFPLIPSFLCIVAPLKILEALKTSHINYPSNFQKNIIDLHILRDSLGYNKMLITQPLCIPQRDEPIEHMLKTRIMETEIIQRALNMTNEEFFEHDNKLFVQRRIPHDEIHELVKYGDHPIYESLKIDKV